MCSTVCPCDVSNLELWSGYGETFFNGYDRTLVGTTSPNSDGDKVSMIFLSEADATTAGFAGVFDDFMTCYEEVIAPMVDDGSDYAKAAE